MNLRGPGGITPLMMAAIVSPPRGDEPSSRGGRCERQSDAGDTALSVALITDEFKDESREAIVLMLKREGLGRRMSRHPTPTMK